MSNSHKNWPGAIASKACLPRAPCSVLAKKPAVISAAPKNTEDEALCDGSSFEMTCCFVMTSEVVADEFGLSKVIERVEG